MNSIDVANIDKVRDFFKELKPSIFPLNEHPLKNEEEYTKEIYITLLCSISQYDNVVSLGENNLIRRIITGIGLEDDITKYLKRGLEIDNELVSEFVRAFSESDLSYNFILDSLVLSACDGKIDEKVIDFVAELAEVLKIDRQKIEFISNLALAVLEQNSSKYAELMTSTPHKVSMKNFLYYTKEFANGLIVDEKDYKHFYSKTHSNGDFSKEILLEGCNVVFENIIVDLTKNNGNLNFRGCEDIKFIESEFIGKDKPIIFSACGDISISNCKFRDFEKNAIRITDSKNVKIKNSKFDNCSNNEGVNSVSGGAILLRKIEQVDIKASEFNKCRTTNLREYIPYAGFGTGIYIDCNSSIINIEKCKFIDCNHYSNGRKNSSQNLGTIYVYANQKNLKDNIFIGCDIESN